jgi:hypothetical protein
MTGTLSLGNNPLTSVGPVALATASEVTKGGSRFLFDDTLLFNFAAGRNALPANTTGGNSTAIGQYALLANTIGSYNTALGRSAMFSNTTGTFNVALGSLALGNNTTGGRNTAIGDYALRSNTTGGYNVAVGQYAMQVTGTAFANVAVGNNSLRNNTAGVGNVALGPGALYYSTGNTNVAVGYGAGNTVTTGSNNILIGHNGTSGDSGIIRIGGGAQTAAFIDGIHGATAAGGLGVFVNADGQLGTATSSRRFKEDIAELGGASEALFDLRPVSFHYTEEAVGPGERPLEYGLIAEEVAEVFPELVVYGEDGAPYTVRYHLLVPLLLNEVQRERVRSEALLARIEALEGRRAGDGT